MSKILSSAFRFICACCLLLIGSPSVYSQYYFERELATPVTQNGSKLSMPWVGGLNGLQYSQMDLNKDGQLDIITYDKSTTIIHCFIKNDTAYQYAPQYNHIFPTPIQNIFQLVDFNQDGKLDVFTTGNLGVVVYENTSSGENFSWQKVNSFLTYESIGGNQVNLQIVVNDYPYIGDIDKDGDIDILNFNSNGLDSKIIFYENRSIDLSGKADIEQLFEANKSWGDIEECNCGEFAFNGTDCTPLKTVKKTLHIGGKSVFVSDLNKDLILELITSHQACTSVFNFLGAEEGFNPVYNNFNTELINNAQTPTQSLYPNTMPLVDDNGNITHLIVSPNLTAQLGIAVDFEHSNWLYQVNTAGQVQLLTKSFLQEEMIDWGIQSSPSFWDYDKDGDLDLFLAYTNTDEQKNLYSGIALYQNIGNATRPEFKLEQTDYLAFSTTNLSNLLIQFEDINADGIQDLAYQASENGQNKLMVRYGNSSGTFVDALSLDDVFIGFGYSFHFTPILGTNQCDLLIGKSSGGLILYENKSTLTNLNFEKASDNYLSIGDDFFKSSLKVTSADLDNDQKMDLIVSDRSGVYKIYSNFLEETAIIDSLLLPNNQSFLGESNILTTANLYDPELPSIIAGNLSGGLTILRNSIEYNSNNTENSQQLILYPNPNNGNFNINIKKDGVISIIAINGEVVYKDFKLEAGIHAFDLNQLKAGLYIIKAQFNNGSSATKKLLLQ